MRRLVNIALLVLICVVVAVAQGDAAAEAAGGASAPPAENPEGEEYQKAELDREAIENIMRTVSPGCRYEIEGAMESRGDVSEDCQAEIQGAIQSLNIKPKVNRPRRNRNSDGSDEAGEAETAEEAEARKEARRQRRRERESRKAKSSFVVHPAVTMLAYLVLIGGGLFAFWKYNLADNNSNSEEAAPAVGGDKSKGGKKKGNKAK